MAFLLDVASINTKYMLYENQQIGNFNYQLGYYLGKNNYLKPFSINTYQQTHGHDKTVGDMFGNLGGKYFIIEFKRSAKDYVAELSKKHRSELIEKIKETPQLTALSKKGHFLCHANEMCASHINMKQEYIFTEFQLSPYIELMSKITGDNTLVINGMEEFAMNIAFDTYKSYKTPIGMSYQEIKEYLNLMKECVGEDDYETTGAVSCFSQESGSMVSIKFESLKELSKQLNLSIDRYTEFSKAIDLNQSRPQLPPKKNKKKGLSM